MNFAAFLLFFINISIIVFGYFFLKRKITRLTTNQEVLKDIKSEINDIITRLDEVTYNNIDLVETKTKKLHSLLKYVEKRTHSLENRIKELDLEIESKESKLNNFTYSPQKIVKQSGQSAENLDDTLLTSDKTRENVRVNSEAMFDIDSLLKEMNLSEKVEFLLERGFSETEIKNKLSLSSGEMEFILNFKTVKS